jgi:hypothetical protein
MDVLYSVLLLAIDTVVIILAWRPASEWGSRPALPEGEWRLSEPLG